MISRRQFCKTAGVATLGAVATLSGCGKPHVFSNSNNKSKKRPNLVFVFSDQQSRDALGCYGNKDVITPNIDRLAGEGLKFDHCVSSSPVCTPYRAMLMSSQHPLHCGALHNDVPLLANNGKYFGHVLKESGYRTAYIGKWHLLGGDRNRPIPAGPMRYGFDEVFQSNNCHVNFRPGHCYYWNEQGQKEYFDEWEVYGQTHQALDYLDKQSDDEPFAMFVSWHPPHDIGINPKSLIFKYGTEPELMKLYDPEKLTLRPSAIDSPELRKAYQGYYAMCAGCDIAMGWILDKLKEKGLEENTIVIYSSDHGDNLTSYGYHIAKDHPEDTASRIPFIMRWPGGLPKPRKSDLLVGVLDMMPTLLGLMGLEVPDTCQGKNLAKAILTENDDAVESVPMFFFHPSWRGVYTRDVTYGFGELRHFANTEKGKVTLEKVKVKALYDRRNDPYQLNNLYGKASAKKLQARMETLTQQWMDYFGDPGLHVSKEFLEKTYKMPDGRWPEDVTEEGFPGRPIDIV